MARLIVVVVGLLNVATAIILVQTEGSALSMWFTVSAIASGGLASLSFLAFLSRRGTRSSAWTGIACGSIFTVWAVLTKGAAPLVNLAPLNYPGDDVAIGAAGNIILFVTGLAASILAQSTAAGAKGTVWHWLASRLLV